MKKENPIYLVTTARYIVHEFANEEDALAFMQSDEFVYGIGYAAKADATAYRKLAREAKRNGDAFPCHTALDTLAMNGQLERVAL